MEHRLTYILRHKESQLYISTAPESYHTRKLTQARRFYDTEQIDTWLQVSIYAPEDSEAYEPVSLKITYELESVEHE